MLMGYVVFREKSLHLSKNCKDSSTTLPVGSSSRYLALATLARHRQPRAKMSHSKYKISKNSINREVKLYLINFPSTESIQFKLP